MSKTEKCCDCGKTFPSESEELAYSKNAGEGYTMCWGCWDDREREREEALASLD